MFGTCKYCGGTICAVSEWTNGTLRQRTWYAAVLVPKTARIVAFACALCDRELPLTPEQVIAKLAEALLTNDARPLHY